MNNYRTVRQYIKRLTDTDLIGMWNVTKLETDVEGIAINYYVEAEMEKRGMHEKLTERT